MLTNKSERERELLSEFGGGAYDLVCSSGFGQKKWTARVNFFFFFIIINNEMFIQPY